MKESKRSNTAAIPFTGEVRQTAEDREKKLLAELEERLAEIDLPRREVSSVLDKAVLNYAEQAQKKYAARQHTIGFVKKYVLGLAAALAICVCLTFVLQQQTTPQQQVTAFAGSQIYHADDQDMMNMELLLISSSIRNSSERLTRTAALSAALDIPR